MIKYSIFLDLCVKEITYYINIKNRNHFYRMFYTEEISQGLKVTAEAERMEKIAHFV